MATDPKWAALRTWLNKCAANAESESTRCADVNNHVAAEYYAGESVMCRTVLSEMRRLSRQRPKRGAKKR